MSREDGALLYCRDQVASEAGAEEIVLRGGYARGTGLRSILRLNSIIATTSVDRRATEGRDGGSDVFTLETTASDGDSAQFVDIHRNDRPRIIRITLYASGDTEWGLGNIGYGCVDAIDAAGDATADGADN